MEVRIELSEGKSPAFAKIVLARARVHELDEAGRGERVLAALEDRVAAMPPFSAVAAAPPGRPGRHRRDPPVAVAGGDAALQVTGHPRAGHQARDGAVGQARGTTGSVQDGDRRRAVPARSAGSTRSRTSAVPASCRSIVTFVVAADRERVAAGVPDHAGDEAGVAGVVGDVLVRVRRVQLLGVGDVLVPGGRARSGRTCRRPSCCRTAPSGRCPAAARRAGR